MNYKTLIEQIRKKKSFLCIGLDTDIDKIPKHLLAAEDPIFEFNKAIIDATKSYCVAYKPNVAFYERFGAKGWESLEKTLRYIPPTHFTIADAKRGDIGNTSEYYAKAFFEQMSFDALTVAPYMGSDSVQPFLRFEGKWVVLLGLTSNKGSHDFQTLELKDGTTLFHKVLEVAAGWGTPENLMFVAGATHASELAAIRKIVPHHFLLIPGIGAQGGDLQTVAESTLNADIGILVNASRSILYVSQDHDFAEKASQAAAELQTEMAMFF